MTREIITTAQMRAIDAASAMAGVPTRTLMENAGKAVADAICRRFTPRATTVLCGPGANGGDGWVAARVLRERGWPVQVATLVLREALTDDAADAASAWLGEVRAFGEDIPAADLYVDALFGAGLARPLEGATARLVETLSRTPEHVVAIDLPSGLNGDTGAIMGEQCIRAGLTVTFVRKKPAHVLAPGRALCGEVVVADIGAPDTIIAAMNIDLFENDPSLWALPWPGMEAHKHERGHVMVASGGRARTGAARLTARAALRVGAGLVTVLSPPEAVAENAAQLTAIMLREASSPADFVDAAKRASCLVMGPAFGTTTTHATLLHAALGASGRKPIVLDADAITLLAPITTRLGSRDVLTPHLGEFKRAFPSSAERAANRIEATRAAARIAGCVVLLKGPDTVIAAPDGRALVNTTGLPFLATAGSGDVLAGLIGGLIGEGMESFAGAAAGVWLHGKCAEAVGPGLIAEDLPEVLPRLLNDLAPAGLKKRPPDS